MFLHILAKGIFLNEERGIHKHNDKWWWIHSKYFVFEVPNVSWIVASSECCNFLPYFCQSVRMMLIGLKHFVIEVPTFLGLLLPLNVMSSLALSECNEDAD